METRELWRCWSAKMSEARLWKERAETAAARGEIATAMRAQKWQKLAAQAANRYRLRAIRQRAGRVAA